MPRICEHTYTSTKTYKTSILPSPCQKKMLPEVCSPANVIFFPSTIFLKKKLFLKFWLDRKNASTGKVGKSFLFRGNIPQSSMPFSLKILKICTKEYVFLCCFPGLGIGGKYTNGATAKGGHSSIFRPTPLHPIIYIFIPRLHFTVTPTPRNIATRKQPSQKSGVSYQIVNITASAENARGGRK